MALASVVIIALAAMASHVWRDRCAAAERTAATLEANRERAELLNRLQHPDVRPFVQPIVTPVPRQPKPGDQDADPDGWNDVGTDTSRTQLQAA